MGMFEEVVENVKLKIVRPSRMFKVLCAPLRGGILSAGSSTDR